MSITLSHLRPVRLNNPGDVSKGDNWLGLAINQPDPRFCNFATPVYGWRALGIIILHDYVRLKGCDNIHALISHYAPPKNSDGTKENDTDAYIASVVKDTGWGAMLPLDFLQFPVLQGVAQAMANVESNRYPWDISQRDQGLRLASWYVQGELPRRDGQR